MAARWIIPVVALLGLISPLTYGLKDDAGASPEGEELYVTSILFEPYTRYDNDSKSLVGFIPDLLQAMCKGGYITCDYELQLVKDGQWGERADSGGWSGMIGEVVDEDADLAAAALAITTLRKTAIDFTDSVGENSLTLLVNKNDDPAITSLNDLLERDDVKFGGIEGGGTLASIGSNREDPYPRIWAKLSNLKNNDSSVMVKNYEEGVQKVLKGKYVMIGDMEPLKYQAALWCSLQTADSFMPHSGYGFGVKKGNTELKDKVNEGIKQLLANGKIKELRDKWWYVATCDACRTTTSLTFAILASVFAFIINRK